MLGLYQGLLTFAVALAPQVLKRVTNVVALTPIRLTSHPLKPGKKSINAPDKTSARIGIEIRGWGHDEEMWRS